MEKSWKIVLQELRALICINIKRSGLIWINKTQYYSFIIFGGLKIDRESKSYFKWCNN